MKTYKLMNLIKSALFLCALALMPFSLAANLALPKQESTVKGLSLPINLQDFINTEKKKYTGKISIVPPKKIQFTGKLREPPKQKTTKYVYMALELMHVNPLPTIQHQMFIQAKDGDVIAVYADERIVENIKTQVKLDKNITWHGYHIYNFSRGPAIVVENFELK